MSRPEEEVALLSGKANNPRLANTKSCGSHFDLSGDSAWLTNSNDFGTMHRSSGSIEDAPKGHHHHSRTASTYTWLSKLPSWLGISKHENQRSNQRKSKWRILFDVENTPLTNVVLAVIYTMVSMYAVMIFVGPLILFFRDKNEWCQLTQEERDMFLLQNGGSVGYDMGDDAFRRQLSGDSVVSGEHPYPNPDYNIDPCRYVRFPFLAYITLEECDVSRRLLAACLLGGAIGYERRSADRPAGIRTMGLVSLGACFFTISSIMAFKSSTQTWDSSRVTAALPSGVGFLGGALIWKGSVFVGSHEMHQVHGLTTAASLWLSAAVGVGVGGALYLVTIYVTVLVILILRYGPRAYLDKYPEDGEEDGQGPDEDEQDDSNGSNQGERSDQLSNLASSSSATTLPHCKSSLDIAGRREEYRLSSAQLRKSLRNVPTFGS
eukprot:Nitzschia sp. Nitz4//scaffold7_size249615//231674//233194//NITZ4_001217-RA/size249615-snap-gene-0.236-mRNA-1//1//CDS//3329558562//3464//frame0